MATPRFYNDKRLSDERDAPPPQPHSRLLSTEDLAVAAAYEGDDFDVKVDVQPAKPVAFYLPLCLLINVSTLGFGTTLSFTGPTISVITDDLGLCGSFDDGAGNDDGGGGGDDGGNLCARAAFVASCFALGALVGALAAGPAADRVGRRPVYLGNALLFLAGFAAIGLATSFGALVAGRLLTGLTTGIAGVVRRGAWARGIGCNVGSGLGALVATAVGIRPLCVRMPLAFLTTRTSARCTFLS